MVRSTIRATNCIVAPSGGDGIGSVLPSYQNIRSKWITAFFPMAEYTIGCSPRLLSVLAVLTPFGAEHRLYHRRSATLSEGGRMVFRGEYDRRSDQSSLALSAPSSLNFHYPLAQGALGISSSLQIVQHGPDRIRVCIPCIRGWTGYAGASAAVCSPTTALHCCPGAIYHRRKPL